MTATDLTHWRTHPTMAWPHGRELRIDGETVEIRESDGTWSIVPGLTGPPAGAEPVSGAGGSHYR